MRKPLQGYLGAGTLAAAFAFAAACSGGTESGARIPTAPNITSPSSGGDVGFRTNPTPPDPCVPTTASEGFTTNPETTTPPPPPCPVASGRFTGGGFQINENDLRVSRGFTLHCDAILSNNFEVNWAGGNNFKIDKNPTDVVCSLIANPNPPDAPVNRIEINGTGTLNGQPAIVTLVLIDNGEKSGAPLDRAYIAVNGIALTDGSVADPAPIDGGNIQAHFDQPHK